MSLLKHLKLCFIALALLFQTCASIPKNKVTELDLPHLIPYRDGKLWGFCDKNKKIKIKCEYDKVNFFNEYGLAKVSKKDTNSKKYNAPHLNGIIDTLGNIIVPLNSNNEFKIIKYDGGNKHKFGPFEATVYGDIQILIKNLPLSNFHNHNYDGYKYYNFGYEDLGYRPNIIAISDPKSNGKVYNRNGDLILPDSFAMVAVNKDWPSIVESKYYFSAKHTTGNYVQVFDSNGKLLNDKKFKKVENINDTLYVGQDIENNTKGLYNISGETLFEGLVEIINPFGIRQNDKDIISLVSDTDEALYSLKFQKYIIPSTSIGKFSFFKNNEFSKNIRFLNDMAYMDYGKEKPEFGLYSNITGEMIVQGYPQLHVHFFYKYIMAKNSKTIRLFNFEGKLLNDFADVDTVIPISKKHFLVSRNNKVGIWSLQSNSYIIDTVFDNINFSLPDVFLAQNEHKKITVYDSIGKKVFPFHFEKQSVYYESQRGSSQYYRRISFKDGLYFMPIAAYSTFSGSSYSTRFYFLYPEDLYPGYYSQYDFYYISDFYITHYDRIVKEINKEFLTLVVEDSIGNRYRLMPDFTLALLSNESELYSRIQNVYFYGRDMEDIDFYIGKDGVKHVVNRFEFENNHNKTLLKLTKKEGKEKLYFALNPETSIRSKKTFKELWIKESDDSSYYIGLSGNRRFLMTSDFEIILKLSKNQFPSHITNDYFILYDERIFSSKKQKYNNERLLNKRGKIIFRKCRYIEQTRFKHLFGLRYPAKYGLSDFVGYADINGNKYFKN